VGRELFEQSAGTRQRQMAHIAGRFPAPAGANQFVVTPERAVDQGQVAGSGGFRPFRIAPGKGRRDEDALAALLKAAADGCFIEDSDRLRSSLT